MIIVIAVAMLTWVISFLIIRAISRYREYAADRGSAQITGKPIKLANALMKITGTIKNIPTRDLRQEEGLNAFFIIPALSGSTVGNLFSTHPPIQKRVEKLMEMEASMS
jgi:heat shock protein HtpX